MSPAAIIQASTVATRWNYDSAAHITDRRGGRLRDPGTTAPIRVTAALAFNLRSRGPDKITRCLEDQRSELTEEGCLNADGGGALMLSGGGKEVATGVWTIGRRLGSVHHWRES